MKIERDARGIDVIDFLDATKTECSMQDSSLASEACCWLGVSRLPRARNNGATRMHLTVEMARRIARAMYAAIEGREFEHAEFTDRYASTCVIAAPSVAGALIAVGVTRDFNSDEGRPMQLDRPCIEGLMPFLLGFIAEGVISGKGGASEIAITANRVLDVKIPVSMLGRTDLGETGVSAQDLIDAFVRLHRRYGENAVSSLGHDNAVRMEHVAAKIGMLASKV